MLAARSIASCLIVGLMLAISPTSASTRSGPKSLTTLKALIVGDPSYSSVESDQLAFGVMLAINDINNNRPTVLPDVTLVADRIDANLTNPGTTYRQFLELAKLSTYSLWAGPLSTELTTASTLFASYKNILSFSPTANSTIFSDKTVYGSFWRYTNPVENLALPSIALLKHFNWTDVVLTWVEGTEGATLADTFSTTAIANNITMVAKVPFAISHDKDLYMQTLGPLKFIRSTKARIIVLAGGPSAGIDIMIAANRLGMINNGYVWISLQSLFSPDFARQQSYWGSEFNPSILKGALQLLTPRGQNTTATALTNFKSIFDSYVPLALSTNGAYFNCFTTTNASSPCFYPNALYEPETNNLVPAYNILSGYDGVMTAALAMDSVVDASFSTGASLKGPLGSNYGNVTLSSIVASALSYSCLSGISSFTVSGDPGVPYMITLWNGGSWVPSVAQVHVGTISVQVSGSSASPSVILDKSKYFWADGSLAMSGVPPQYPVLLEEYISWDTPDTKAIIAIYIVFWIILAATIVVLAIKGRSPDVRNISPHYLLLLTIGIAIASLNILTLPGKVKVAGCLWRPWPLSAGICIVFVAILAKAHHIYYVYDNIELYKLPSLLFNSPRIYLLVFAVSVVNGAILVAYLLKAPLISGFVYDEAHNKNTYLCIPSSQQYTLTTSLLWLTISLNLLLLISTIMFAFWIRNAPSQLGNARQLGYVVYISALLTLIVMVGGFSGISTVTTEFFVESIVVLFGLVTIYGFLVAAPLFGAVTGYVSKTLPGIQGFGTSRDNSGTTSAITSVSQNNAGQPAARGMRGRKRGTFKLTFKDELKEVGANLQTLFESINGTVHHREGFLQCTTHIVPTWSAVTVTLVLDGLNLLLCVGGSDDQTTEFNIANLISVEVLEKHPTESVPNCLILKQVTQTHILQLKSYAQVYTLAGELAKKMIPEDSEEQRMTLQNTDRVLKSVVLVTANDMMQTPLSDRKKVAANGVKPLPKKSDVDFEDDY
ncbi:hypothetical protein BASA62_000653 [Batrachochytrium salamandrivorans]|nr:hypothetical protein BASA62_000653 [Batrachochytrium salamandrivorans]